MRIRFRQSGGFGGLTLGVDLDTKTLSSAESRRLANLVAESGLRDLKAKGPSQARDLATYEITIEMPGGRKIAATFDDMSVPAAVEPLLDFLRERAVAKPPGK